VKATSGGREMEGNSVDFSHHGEPLD
jgi:hypothetical protein